MAMLLRSLRTGASKLTTIQTSPAAFRYFSSASLKDSYDHIQVDVSQKEKGVGLIRLHRPKAMNALCDALFDDLIHASTAMDDDDDIGCLVVTGSDKAFAAGADISEMKDRTFEYTYTKVNEWI